MELSFEYYDWLKWLNENSPLLIFISIFGAFLFLIAMALLRGFLQRMGLRFIAGWKFFDYLMICIFATGFIGGFLILLLTAVIFQPHTDSMTGIRFILILGALFLCISAFYLTNMAALEKWFDDAVVVSKESPKKSSKKRKKSRKK